MSGKLLISLQNIGRQCLLKRGCISFCNTAKKHCSNGSGIDGTWENQWGSRVEFKTSNKGQLDGTYISEVGNAECKYALSGRYDHEPRGVVLLGWVVAWNNFTGDSHSVTSWSGLYYPKEDVIRTQWLLTYHNPIQTQEYWETTMVNHGEFRRVK